MAIDMVGSDEERETNKDERAQSFVSGTSRDSTPGI